MPNFWKAAGSILKETFPVIANVAGGLFGADRQADQNMKLAKFQHQQNLDLLNRQLQYNSPSAQMARFKDAGLNPNLIYGQGSSGNMESPPRYPDIKAADYQAALAGIGTQVQQANLMKAQTDLTNQKVDESGVKQSLMKQQAAVLKANPFLNSAYVTAFVENMKQSALLKERQAKQLGFFTEGQAIYNGAKIPLGAAKIRRELDLLAQRFDLGEKDKKIKAEIFQSKDFQNQLSEIQLKWMRDSEITPQHIYMGIMLLLQKML